MWIAPEIAGHVGEVTRINICSLGRFRTQPPDFSYDQLTVSVAIYQGTPVVTRSASGARSQACAFAPTNLLRELHMVVLFLMKSSRRHIIVAERRASLRDCAQHSSAVFGQVVS
jgi:hypothetical protein